MKFLKFLVGVTCVIVSISGILYIKEKIGDEIRMREIIKKGPTESKAEWVNPSIVTEDEDGNPMTIEFGPRYE